MTQQSARIEAERIVEMFRKVLYDGKLYHAQFNDPSLMHDTKKCVDVSIKHVEGILEAILEATEGLCSYPSTWCKWNDILNELKQM